MTDVWEGFRPKLLIFGLVALALFLIGVIGAFADFAAVLLLVLAAVVGVAVLVGTVALWIIRSVDRVYWGAGLRKLTVLDFAGPALFAAIVLLALPLCSLGQRAGDLARLAVNLEHYETIIAQSRAAPAATSFEEHDGVTYSIDPGPPVRVAFNPAGLLDNWSAIVFDPTGEVMLVDAPPHITRLFGGDLVGCRPLWGSYYKCSFT